jgi:GH24 family phage-related lysozyme (muramidase)
MTVGYGHLCVEDFWDENTEYTEAQLDRIFDTDFDKAIEGAARVCEGMDLPDKKFGVFIEMTFQLGATGLSKFKKALAAAREHQWQECHDQLLDSRWYKQTPNRAKQLAEIMLED